MALFNPTTLKISVLFTWLSWISAHSNANETLTLKVGYVEFPPFEYTNQSGKASGLLIDVLRKTLDEAGYQADYLPLPISRVYLYLQTGEIDLWPGLRGVPVLRDYVVESKSTPMSIGLSAWYLANTPPPANVDDLKNKSIIAIAGYTYGGLLYFLEDPKNNVRLLFTPNHKSGLQMLNKKRGDYLLDYNEPVFLSLDEQPVEALQHKLLKLRYGSFVLSKKSKNWDKIIDAIDNAYMRLINQNKIPKPYFTDPQVN